VVAMVVMVAMVEVLSAGVKMVAVVLVALADV
jgi:hypothetical protein